MKRWVMTPAPSGQANIVRTEQGLTIASTRTSLYDVMDFLKAQYSPKLIPDKFNFTDAQVGAALLYIEANRTQVKAIVSMGSAVIFNSNWRRHVNYSFD